MSDLCADGIHRWYESAGGDFLCARGCGTREDRRTQLARMYRAGSQKQRIVARLQLRPQCGTTLLDARMPRYAARIKELRDDGWPILTRRCKAHSHRSAQVEYFLR